MSSLKSSQGSNRIRELREKRGLTQKQLGEEMNTVQSNISRYEEGTRDIPTKTLFDLSCFFGVSVYYLMMEEKAIKGGRYEVLTEKSKVFHRKNLTCSRNLLTFCCISDSENMRLGNRDRLSKQFYSGIHIIIT